MKLASFENLPIGVFDSGIGGLTVLSALKKKLPHESFIYLGDTARLPYGTKSADTICNYTSQVTELLFQRGIKLLVIACNTATAYGLSGLQQSHPNLPVIGVIEPGAEEACNLSKKGHVLVLCTEATARSEAYREAILKLNPKAKVIHQACGLFVSLVEEGFSTGIVAREVSQHYLEPLLHQAEHFQPDCLVLGCTHFPVLAPVIHDLIPNTIKIVDSAETTAESVQRYLKCHHLETSSQTPVIHYLCTDSPQRFAKIGSTILAETITANEVELVDITAP